MVKVKTIVESFELDHDIVKAPYVRLIGVETGPKGDKISNFDFRFTQPNISFLDVSSIHTLEHSLAGLIRDKLKDKFGEQIRLIDVSPFGCLTGFHAIFWGEPSVKDITEILVASLKDFLDFEQSDVPGVAKKQCGSYKMHSLFGAKEWAELILADGFSLDPFERVQIIK